MIPNTDTIDASNAVIILPCEEGVVAHVVCYDDHWVGTVFTSSHLLQVFTIEAARKLGVKKIVLGACGHAHKALSVISARVLVGDINIPVVYTGFITQRADPPAGIRLRQELAISSKEKLIVASAGGGRSAWSPACPVDAGSKRR